VVAQLCILANIDKNNRIDPEVGLYRTVIKNAVSEVMRKKGNAGGFSDVRDELMNNQNIKSPQTIHIVEKLEYILRSYSEGGRYAGYFNGKATVNIKSDLSVFELSDLEHNQDLQTSVLLTVIFLVYSKMRSRERRMSLIIDEAWKLLPHPAIRDFIDGIARRARKYQGSLEVATQRISDFDKSKSEAAAAVLGITEWIVLFSVEGKESDILKNQLNMSDAEIEIARKLCGLKGSYSEFMLRNKNGTWQICRLLLDKFSAKLYSTSADDVVAIRKLKAQGLSIVDAVNHLITSEAA
jgi:conjugal transfer ATP-binding protein TraC